jgi:hypothetical protein
MATPASARLPGRRPLQARLSRRWINKLVGAGALTVIGVLIAAGLAPFALNERRSSGPVADTAATLRGQAGIASEGLRRLGYACSDSDVSRGVVTRVCTRVRLMESTRVQLFVAADTGAVQRVTTTLHEGRSDQALHGQVLQVLADAVGLQPADRSRVLAAAATNADQLLELEWGTFGVRSGPPAESDLRAGQWHDPPASLSKTTLVGSVDALATAARNQGYVCTTPEIQTIRDCTRKEGGYFFDLWMQGTDAYVATLYLSVEATHRTQTRSHWVDEMAVVLTWLDTEQGRSLSSWLAKSADAPGADSYVDELPISFSVRADEYVKETFGGVTAECGRSVNDISSCAP